MSLANRTDFDVIIVGGGAVGATLGLELDRLNYRVAVIERFHPSFSSSLPERVVALNYGSRCHLERLGIWPGVSEQGTGDIRHIVVSEMGNRGSVGLDAADGADFAPDMQELGYVVEMGSLLKPMYALLEASSVALFSGTTVKHVKASDDGVDIELQSVEQSIGLKGALLVGADGTHSQIRRMAGIETFGWDYNRFALVASVSCENGHNYTAHECFRRSGPLAFLPLADGRYSIVWAATPAEAAQLLAMSDEAFISALQRAAGSATIGQIGAITATSKRVSYPLELTVAKTFTAPHIALIGNAAHTIHPVAGQGMNLGFRDVVSLVEMLDGELAQEDPGQNIILQGYADKRRSDVMAVAGFTETMSHLFGSEVPGVKWLRGMGLDKLTTAPSLSALLLKQASGVGQMNAQEQEVSYVSR